MYFNKLSSRLPIISIIFILCTIQKDYLIFGAKSDQYDKIDSSITLTPTKDYYYIRTRLDPQHLRVSEEFKNKYIDEIKLESKINGTKYEYYKSLGLKSISYDELVFETIDKIFQHRLSPFYIHHYDNDEDKKLSSDPKLVSNEACARDLMYLVDKISKVNNKNNYDNVNVNDNNQDQDQDTNHNHNHDEDYLTPELEAFFDSYARQEAGLLMGNTYWIGAYDQCVNRHIFELSNKFPKKTSTDQFMETISGDNDDKQVVNFKGRYCVSSLKAPIWEEKIGQRLIKNKNYFKTKDQMNSYEKLFRLQVGICLPSSCDSTSFEKHLDEIKLLTTSMLSDRYKNYNLIDLYCLPDETSPLRSITNNSSAFYFIIFITIWFSLLFFATIADICEFVDLKETNLNNIEKVSKKNRRNKIHQFVSWFSLKANYIKLMKVNPENEEINNNEKRKNNHVVVVEKKEEQQQQQDSKEKSSINENVSDKKFDLIINLRFLNAFKVLIMFWIVNGHIMLLMIQTAKNILYSDALLNGLMHFLIGATFGVDLFFTMTGFLTSYLIFNSGHAFKMKLTTWIYLSFHRYWRLAPMYLITFWFSRSVMQLLGSGPLWDYGTSKLTFRGLCNNESWFYPLTLTSNLHGLFEECAITSWYISCDMQFWLISPIFIHLLAKNPIHGWIASLATIFMSSKVRYDSILESEQSARYDELVQPRADIFMRVSYDLPELYTHPHYRISAYIIGLLTGHYVYMIKSGKWKSTIAANCIQSSSSSIVKSETSSNNEILIEEKKEEKINSEKEEENNLIISSQVNRKRSIIAYTGLYLFLIMSFVSYLLSHYYPSSLLKYAKSVSALAYSIDHLIMSLGASMVIVSMCFGQWSKFVEFLSHPIWTRLSKMNYALLLLQCEAIYYQIFRYEQVPLAGTRELINILFNLLVTLYPIAFLVTLAFEFPLANVEKLLI